MKRMLTLFLFVLLQHNSQAQSLAINSTNAAADPSAILDISSDVKGMLIPRVYLTDKLSSFPIYNAANSLIVYNTSSAGTPPNNLFPGYYYWMGTHWQRLLTDNNEAWSLKGNYNTDENTDYIGTADQKNFYIRTNGYQAMSFMNYSNFVGIGETNPGDNLVIKLNTRGVNPMPADFAGIQIKPSSANGSNNNEGLHIGLSRLNSNNAHIMNYSNGDLAMGTNGNDILYLNPLSRFLGVNESSPQDNLTIRLNPAGVFGSPDPFSGLLINQSIPQGMGNNHGIHLGLDNTTFTNARLLNSENGDFGFGTARNIIMVMKGTSRYVGFNTTNPFHTMTVMVGANAVYTTPYDGISLLTPGNGNEISGLLLGVEPNNPANKALWNFDNGKIAFGTTNLERMTITDAGNVGIGTTSPAAKFHVAFGDVVFNAAGAAPSSVTAPISGMGRRMMWFMDKAAFRAGYVDGSQWDANYSGLYSFATGYNTTASGDYSTALGWKTTAKAEGAVVIGTLNDQNEVVTPGTWLPSDRMFQIGNGSGFTGSNIMTVLRSGNVGIGTLNPTEKLHVVGNILASAFNTISDKRYKKNIKPVHSALQKIKDLNGVSYQYNAQSYPNMGFNETTQLGFIAQDVEKVLPEIVQTDDRGYKSIDYSKVTPVLVEAMKAQQIQMEEQQKKITELESALKEMKELIKKK
ncbi:MAG: tail fiber domain-containing protein [Sphingobacteriales bacterium]|nr:tail fiber domain-containing protein [Sphingobacteriales bacterium]